MSMRNRQDHSEPRAYRYYVFVDAERGRGFDDEADARMHFDEEIELAQMSANTEGESYTVSVMDEMSAGKNAVVAMHICSPEPVRKEYSPVRPRFIREPVSKKERA